MYLVSLYFDEKTNGILNQWKDPSRDVPNHITVASFDTDVKDIKAYFSLEGIFSSEVHFVSQGILGKDNVVIYVLLNEYLHELSKSVHESLNRIPDVKISLKYRVWGWIPHVTMASKCTKGRIQSYFLNNIALFHDFTGKVTKIAISKTNPYEDIVVWDLTGKET
ncbi:MAG: hypothetical protein J6E46_02335 [Faecalicoccus sp.]|nr:hypothetical protein [Faecalicoccus sp.]